MSSQKDLENTVVMFVDGEDVMFQSDANTILTKFLAIGKRVLFAAGNLLTFDYYVQ